MGPKGARNGNYRHGLYTAEGIASRRSLRQQIREIRALTGRDSVSSEGAVAPSAIAVPRVRQRHAPRRPVEFS
jgi:hypothetical protein